MSTVEPLTAKRDHWIRCLKCNVILSPKEFPRQTCRVCVRNKEDKEAEKERRES